MIVLKISVVVYIRVVGNIIPEWANCITDICHFSEHHFFFTQWQSVHVNFSLYIFIMSDICHFTLVLCVFLIIKGETNSFRLFNKGR